MSHFKTEFLEYCLSRQVLRFGTFTLKSGRQSPYFFNAGLFNTGEDLARLGQYYAQTLVDSGLEIDMLFGPAYKGIPLAASTAITLSTQHDRNYPWCFNRKEAKDHGEGGNLVGAPLQGRVLIIDDVITAGTAIRESVEIIQAAGATPAGVLIALDRQERGKGDLSAIQEVERDYGLSVLAIANLADLSRFLEDMPELEEHRGAVADYRQQYGIA